VKLGLCRASCRGAVALLGLPLARRVGLAMRGVRRAGCRETAAPQGWAAHRVALPEVLLAVLSHLAVTYVLVLLPLLPRHLGSCYPDHRAVKERPGCALGVVFPASPQGAERGAERREAALPPVCPLAADGASASGFPLVNRRLALLPPLPRCGPPAQDGRRAANPLAVYHLPVVRPMGHHPTAAPPLLASCRRGSVSQFHRGGENLRAALAPLCSLPCSQPHLPADSVGVHKTLPTQRTPRLSTTTQYYAVGFHLSANRSQTPR